MTKAKKKTKSSKKTKAKKVKKAKTAKPKLKKRYLIRELTAFIEAKGPDKVTFAACRKLAKEIKPDTTFNEVYFKILVGRIKSNLKKPTSKKKKKK